MITLPRGVLGVWTQSLSPPVAIFIRDILKIAPQALSPVCVYKYYLTFLGTVLSDTQNQTFLKIYRNPSAIPDCAPTSGEPSADFVSVLAFPRPDARQVPPRDSWTST